MFPLKNLNSVFDGSIFKIKLKNIGMSNNFIKLIVWHLQLKKYNN